MIVQVALSHEGRLTPSEVAHIRAHPRVRSDVCFQVPFLIKAFGAFNVWTLKRLFTTLYEDEVIKHKCFLHGFESECEVSALLSNFLNSQGARKQTISSPDAPSSGCGGSYL